MVASETSSSERPAGLHLLENTAVAADPKMDRARKEFRIAEIRMEIAKLNFEKQTLRAELANDR